MYNKIYIIGPVGSGKTTLARLIADKYNIKHYELDKIVWNDEEHIKREEKEIQELFKKIINKKSWIIEDVGRSIFINGIKKADIVYYLDLSKITIYKRCISRWIKQKIGKEKYNYKPTLKSLYEMLKWAKQDINKKDEKIKRIITYSKKYKLIKKIDTLLSIEVDKLLEI